MKNILLVEDDQHLAEGLTMNLEAEGYQVISVASGRDVPQLVTDGNFDLILLDIMLPGADGLTVCRQLRQDGHLLPVLFLTARDRTDEKIEGLLAGGEKLSLYN